MRTADGDRQDTAVPCPTPHAPRSTKLVVGLIGGIGSGKSAVAEALGRRGGRVIVADALGHEALRQPEIKSALVARWGPGILDDTGEVSRKRVAGIVFATTPEAREELKALEALVFPYIGQRITQEIAAAQADPAVRFVVLDAAILLEAGWATVCDRIVYVHAPRAVRLKRLAEGRGWTEKEVEQRERMQLSLTEKATRADDAIDNSGSREDLDRRIDDLLHRWGAVGVFRS